MKTKTKRKQLWFVRESKSRVGVYKRKPSAECVRKKGNAHNTKSNRLHDMCWGGFLSAFGVKLRIGEIVRLPTGAIGILEKLKPRKKHIKLEPSYQVLVGVKEAFKELIGQFLQGPPLPPIPAVTNNIPGTTWTIEYQPLTNITTSVTYTSTGTVSAANDVFVPMIFNNNSITTLSS